MKKTLLSLLLMLLPVVASAGAVEIGGIYYNLDSEAKTAEVAKNKYSGDIIIPEVVENDGQTYTVTSIGENAFYQCTNLTSVSIPESVTTIGYMAFWRCTKLTNFTIPNSVTTIGNYAFAKCIRMTSISIGSSVTSISEGMFSECSSLEAVDIPNSVTSIGHNAFQVCSNLKSVTIGNSVTSINDNAFASCKSLSNVTFGNSVISIGSDSFHSCDHLTSITIPESLYLIGSRAFYGCESLTDVYCYSKTVPFIDSEVFGNVRVSRITLHVPAKFKDVYEVTATWKAFGNIVPIEELSLEKCATPTVDYTNGVFSFGCETEGVEYVLELPVSNVEGNGEFNINGIHSVSVYARKEGYENSESVTMLVNFNQSGLEGDVNNDGEVNAVDLTKLIEILLQ